MTQAPSNKRSRRDANDDNRAECPFVIKPVDLKEKEIKIKSKKRRKRGHNINGNHPDDDDAARKVLHQCVPFEPQGSFGTHGNNMDVHYVVEPAKQWSDMTRYNSFVLNGVKYFCDKFIFVANDSSIERQKSAASAAGAGFVGQQRSSDDWVARILEIRASDEHHVYARVFWMYWPDELPVGTHYRKKPVQGRQPYHGASELIASNHMDIINVVSVTSMATVNHLNEDKDDDVQSALYWRQALDVRNLELTTLEDVCDCDRPANPDKMLVGCGDSNCGRWIHEECLTHYALMRVYERLGRDTPHRSTKAVVGAAGVVSVKAERSTDDVKEPLSPSETGGAVSAQPSIDVKADTVEVAGQTEEEDEEENVVNERNGAGDDADDGSDKRARKELATSTKVVSGNDAVGIGKQPVSRKRPASAATTAASTDDGDTVAEAAASHLKKEGTPSAVEGVTASGGLSTPTPAPTGPAGAAGVAAATTKTPVEAPLTVSVGGGGSRANTKKRLYPTLHSFDGKKKPYDKLFEASLLLSPSPDDADDEQHRVGASAAAPTPTMIEIRDLRTHVIGGDKVWQEPAECPVCGSAIR
ncbi:BAH-domain containing protein [Niveomyces insectorum RCEF 264]|uniref:BAH-domain containing protein n=1 Tax=Niveomyces insectorum RCEF 264 TaxID=1081102 RepID=A0A167M5E8_9HYPO|nr:BAH-domain containing protein [Niveomyces insectorum RCEF 264]